MGTTRPILDGITHGGRGAYGYNLGCRCDVCTRANADRQRANRARDPELAERQREAARAWQRERRLERARALLAEAGYDVREPEENAT